MKFVADILFEDFPRMFCQELDEGYQIFTSWEEFVSLYLAHMHSEKKPLYVFEATVTGNNVFVNAGQLIEVPWDELKSYI